MFGTIRKHQTWLWAVIITLTIISFVVFFNPTSRMDSARRRAAGNYGAINGERITDEDFRNAENEVRLQYFFASGGNWYSSSEEAKKNGFDVEQQIYVRLFMIQKEHQFGIHVGPDVSAQSANNMVRGFAQRGIPDVPTFVKQVLNPHGLEIEDLDRFVRHEIGRAELMSAAGLSGKLITPQEAQSLYQREHQEVASEAVFFSASNYLADVSATPDAISQFYTNHMPEYRLPERLQVYYVRFPLSNHLAKAEKDFTNLNETVDLNYEKMGTNAFRDAKTPEEARAKLREQILLQSAFPAVRKETEAFTTPLFSLDPPQTALFEQIAKTNGFVAHLSEPFDMENPPKDLNVEQSFTKQAFRLTTNEPFAGPILGKDSVYVIGLAKDFPSENQPLEKVRDRVVADYKYQQAAILARRAGIEFAQTLTNGIPQGKTLSGLATMTKGKVVELPPFSISTQELPSVEEHISLNGRNGLKEVAFTTPPGKVSQFTLTQEGGLVLHVKSLLPINDAKMQSEMANYIAVVRQSRQREAFDAWFQREAQKGLRDIPYFQKRQPEPGAKS